MSLGGGRYSLLNAAVARAVDAGVTFAVAAGNDNADACNSSPASEPKALTVGSTTSSDAKSSFSNHGDCVDIQAPGSSIKSDWVGSTTATATISGTSMASPHVAGAAALVLGNNGSLTPSGVASALIANATSNVVTGLPPGTANRLLYVGFIAVGGSEPPPAQAPSATVSKSCSGFRCTLTANVSNATNPAYEWKVNDSVAGAGSTLELELQPRTPYSYSLKVTATNGTVGPINGTITCNPKKCQ